MNRDVTVTGLIGYFIDMMDEAATVTELVTSWLFVVVNVPLTAQGHTRKTVTTRSMYVVVSDDGDGDDDDNDGYGTGAAEGQERRKGGGRGGRRLDG